MSNDTSREYWATVNSIAAEAMEQPEDGRYDFIHESVDGSYWVIYTHAARKALEFSPNERALFDNEGDQTVSDFTTLFTRGAFYAMCADVNEAIVNEAIALLDDAEV